MGHGSCEGVKLWPSETHAIDLRNLCTSLELLVMNKFSARSLRKEKIPNIQKESLKPPNLRTFLLSLPSSQTSFKPFYPFLLSIYAAENTNLVEIASFQLRTTPVPLTCCQCVQELGEDRARWDCQMVTDPSAISSMVLRALLNLLLSASEAVITINSDGCCW